jgi:rhodanese-related sulfurtransferase
MSKETTDRLGHQKATNYGLSSNMTKEEFMKELLTGLTAPPQYFPLNVMMNKQGYESLDTVIERGTHALTPEAFEAAANETGALILDTRDPKVFAQGFIPNSINIGVNGNFAPWVGTLLPDIQQPILLVTEEGREEEVIIRLARVGYDHAIGYLKGGMEAWKNAGKEIDTISSITPTELADIKSKEPVNILDVRRKSEYDSEHIISAENAPLDYLNDSMLKVDKSKTTYVHCAGGYRSMIFISALKARGYEKLVNINGGLKALKESGKFNITNFVRPITEL